MTSVSTSTVRILSVDAQRHRVKLSNQRTVGYVTARKVYSLDPEDWLARQSSRQAVSQPASETPQTPSGVHKLAGGALAWVGPDGRATLIHCDRDIRVS